MTQQNFNETVKEQVNKSLDLLVSKGKEYEIDGGDRLQAFKVAASLTGESQIKALAGMMAKHTVSIYDMCNSDAKQYSKERWEEKITDSINYLLILKAMVIEELEKEEI